MYVSTLPLLVLTSCVATFVGNNRHSATRALGDVAGGKIHIIGGSENGKNVVGTLKENDHRQRRAVISFNAAFLKAWKAILKTTMGSTFRLNEKAFFKVGTLDDAMKDFISFRPKGIFNDARFGSLQGYVGNQVIKIETNFINEPVITIYSRHSERGPIPYGKHRSIYYFKNQEEAEKYLRELKTYGLGS